MDFGGAAEIWTQVARPPALQDGPGYPTAPQSKFCFLMATIFLCSAIVNYCNQICSINGYRYEKTRSLFLLFNIDFNFKF